MLRMKLPPKRRLPPYPNPENIRIRTNKVLKEKGVENHFQALYFTETAKFLMSNNDPRFDVYKPALKPMQTKAWKTALEFCIAFLSINQQHQTIEAIQAELHGKQISSLELFSNDQNSLQFYFRKLLNFSHDKLPIPFAKRVKENKKFQDFARNAIEAELKLPSIVASAPNLSLPPMIERAYTSTRSEYIESKSVKSKSSETSKHNPPLFIKDELRNDVNSYPEDEDDEQYPEEETQNESQSQDMVEAHSLHGDSFDSIPKQVYSYQYTGSYESDS